MRALHLINCMTIGGAPKVVLNLLTHLARTNTEIELEVAVLYDIGHFGELLINAGIPVQSLKARFKYDPQLLPHLISFLQKGKFDIVHVHLFPAYYLAACSSVLVQSPKWIYTEHNVWNRRRKYPVMKLVDAGVYSRYDRIIACSTQAAKALIAWLPFVRNKVWTIPNAVKIPASPKENFRALSGNKILFLFAGRLEYAKGIDILLRALYIMKDKKFDLLIVGDGSQRQRLEQLSADMQLSEQVKFLGERADLPDLMRTADCLIMPSRWEGLPMVLLEAMATGLPVIASAAGGIPEVIQDGINGYLVPPENVAALAQRLQSVIDNPVILQSMGRLARERITEEYSIDKMAQSHLQIYQEVLGISAAKV